MSESLEFTLTWTSSDGMAYLEDNTGKEYFCEHVIKSIRPLIDGKDNHPLMTQLSTESFLAERGKTFSDLDEAKAYIQAVSAFDDMLLYAYRSLYEQGDFRDVLSSCLSQVQESIKKTHSEILRGNNKFDKYSMLLDMNLDEITQELWEGSL